MGIPPEVMAAYGRSLGRLFVCAIENAQKALSDANLDVRIEVTLVNPTETPPVQDGSVPPGVAMSALKIDFHYIGELSEDQCQMAQQIAIAAIEHTLAQASDRPPTLH